MARAGRELEQLVERLESVLGGTPVTVTSPEYIEGRMSHTQREVDVSLRGKVGSASVFVMVECRDRDSVQGVEWLDQVAGKRDDVGADKAVIVSSAGFTSGAREYAESRGIELRALSEVSAPGVFSWLGFENLELWQQQADIKSFTASLAPTEGDIVTGVPSALEDALTNRETRGTARVFRVKSTGEMVSVADIWSRLPIETQGGNIEPMPEHRTLELDLDFPNEDDRYQLETNEGWRDIGRIVLVAEIWADVSQVPIDRMYEYVGDDGALVQTVQFAGIPREGKPHILALHVVPGHSVAVIEVREEESTTQD